MADPTALHLMPMPRQITRQGGTFQVRGPLECPAAKREFLAIPTPIGATTSVPVRLARQPHSGQYVLHISLNGITITASDEAAVAHAARTLSQLVAQFGHELPCLTINDWPDFPVRGVMLDVSRDKVPTMDTLRATVDRLAGWKINQLQLYTEHTFAYADHHTVWAGASPLTGDDIRALDAYCRERFIELVPNQNSFGHMERWLKHERYRHLAEAPDGADTPWGFRWQGPFSLCPTDPASLEFLSGLYAELLPNFSSGLFNVGCDETFDIGQGRSRAVVQGSSVTAVYLDFLRRLNERVRSHGRRMMFWGDVILHHPEQIVHLPPGVTALNWGYEADHPFDAEAAAFAAAGVPFYVCPGTSTWNSIAGRTDNCLANLGNAADAGRRHGAAGYLITDWGDDGHLQYASASYLGLMAGAAMSWCGEAHAYTDWADALDRFAFDGQRLGGWAMRLGNVHQQVGRTNVNGATLFRLLVPSPANPHPERDVTAEQLDAADALLLELVRPGTLPDAHGLDWQELLASWGNLRLCVEAGRRRLGLPPRRSPDVPAIVAEHRRLWLARNRPGGLDDSCRRLALP